jgi:hypothetical protein
MACFLQSRNRIFDFNMNYGTELPDSIKIW